MLIKNFFLLFFTLKLIHTNNEISLGPGLSISKFFKNFTGDLKFPLNHELVMFETVNYYSDESAILDKIYDFNLPNSHSSSTDILQFKLNILKYNETILHPSLNYYLKINYPKNLVNSLPKQSSNKFEKNPYISEINYTAPSLNYTLRNFEDISIKSVVSYQNLIFGIQTEEINNLHIYEYDNIILSKKTLSDYVNVPELMKKREIEALYKYESIDGDYCFLVAKIQSNLFIFKLEIALKNYQIEVKITNHLHISHFSLIPKIINKILIRNDSIIVGEKKGSIQIYGLDGSMIREISKFNDPIGETPIYLLDMIMLNNSIYILSEEYGLKILNVTDIMNPNFIKFEFKHPYLKKLDTHRNPYRDFIYIGILVSNRLFNKEDEFFFELKVIDEFNPILNRFYLTSEYLDVNYFLSDNKFSYLYEHYSNSIYIIIRSNIINEYNSVYKFQIPELVNKKVIQEIFFLTNSLSDKPMVSIIAENEVIIIEEIKFLNASFQVKFNNLGKYKLEFVTEVDYCEGNKDKLFKDPDNVYYCSVNIIYDFNVNKISLTFVEFIKSNHLILVSFSVIFVISVIMLIILCYLKLFPYLRNMMRSHMYNDMEDNQIDEVTSKKHASGHVEIATTEIK